ncbi:MAG: histidine kinase dimerization/phospho-acceptor domain-containing protein, partial [Deltaproteobacteria bacterium]
MKGPKTRTNRIWSALTIANATYGFGAYMVSLSGDAQSAFFWWQMAYLGIILIPVFFMHFVYSYLGIKRPVFLRSVYAVSFIFWILDIFRKDLFLGRVSLFFADSKIFKPGYWVYPPSPLLVFYIIFFFFGIALSTHIDMIKGYRSADLLKRNQIKYFFLGTALGFAGGGTSFFPCFNIRLYPVLNILVALYPLVTSYAIIKHRLMDIRVTITRAGIFFAVYVPVLGLPFLLSITAKDWLIRSLGQNWWLGPLLLMAGLGTAGPSIYIYLSKKADAILLREQRRYQDALQHAAVDITRIRNLQKLLDFIARVITESVRISHAAIYYFDAKSGKFILKAAVNLKKGQPEAIAAKNILIDWLEDKKEPLVCEELPQAKDEFKKQMRSLNASIIVPCFLESKLLDVLVLGDKLSGKFYTSEDLNNFSDLGREVALATENALLYEKIEEEVRQRTKELVEMQKQLVQAEKLATVGTLAGGVAHEINNPLTAILTNAQMLLAESGSLDKDSKESLQLIEEATKRCRTIVQKLMTYAKKPLQPAEVSRVNLLRVSENAISLLVYQLEQENITIVSYATKDAYWVIGNHNELEQVLTNIILNAKDAIKKVKKGGIIRINFSEDEEHVKIEIQDEGAGIAKTIMPKIFD